MSTTFTTVVVGNVDNCRTEIEISTNVGDLVAVLFEDLNGWRVEKIRGVSIEIPPSFIEEAKARLSRYANRTGANPPPDLNRTGLALWLMTKDDGTAMGLPVE